MFKTFAAIAIASVASAQEWCDGEDGHELCTWGDNVISACAGEDCWWGYYDEEGFIVGDEDLNGMVCDWNGDCLGMYGGELFALNEWELIEEPIPVDWIEDLFVGSATALAAGLCEHDEDLSEEHEAEVFHCKYEDDEWYFGINYDGFGMAEADESEWMFCSWEGDCIMYGDDPTTDAEDPQLACMDGWEFVDCPEY